jgi:GWxTD domain-containing protein
MHLRVLVVTTLAFTVAHPVFPFQSLRKELATPYKKWLTQDVAYILSAEERQAWTSLETDDEREQFIEQFWLRRDPTPDTVENEFKEEHYRRIAYANERFGSGVPGWKTDRGRTYIKFGPPDEIESHPSGGSYQRPAEEGGGITSTFPFEKWRYRWIEGVGSDIVIEFVDRSMTGEYRMTIDPSDKEALLMVPGAGRAEALGGAPSDKRFDRLQQQALLNKAPTAKFKDLAASVDSTIRFNILPMQARADYFPLTESSVLTNMTVQLDNKDLQFQARDGIHKAVVNIYGRITTMSRRTVQVFEDQVVVNSSAEQLPQFNRKSSVYQRSIPLAPGAYRLNIAIQDVIGGNRNNFEMALNVPRFDPDKLASSSLVLADLIEKVPTRSIGTGQFVIGATKVRPRVSSVFERFEKIGIYLKAYNFQPNENTKKPSGSVVYEIHRNGSHEKVLEFSEDVAAIANASAQQVTIEKVLPLTTFDPGEYTLRMRITDSNSNQTLTPIAVFTVN